MSTSTWPTACAASTRDMTPYSLHSLTSCLTGKTILHISDPACVTSLRTRPVPRRNLRSLHLARSCGGAHHSASLLYPSPSPSPCPGVVEARLAVTRIVRGDVPRHRSHMIQHQAPRSLAHFQTRRFRPPRIIRLARLVEARECFDGSGDNAFMRDRQVEVDGEHGHVWVAVGYVFDGLGDGAVCRVVC